MWISRGCDVDWGDQQVRVIRKGSRAELPWLPGSNSAFVWLRLYLAEIGGVDPGDPVWVTLRRRRDGSGELAGMAMIYEAPRAVLHCRSACRQPATSSRRPRRPAPSHRAR